MADSLMFIWIQGIDGLSQDPRHLREIDVDSYTFAPKGNAGFGGHGSTTEGTGDFEFVKRFDAISPILHQAAASGKHFAKAILTVERNIGGRSAGKLLRIVMSEIVISHAIPTSMSKSPTRDDFESIGLNYASISWKHKE